MVHEFTTAATAPNEKSPFTTSIPSVGFEADRSYDQGALVRSAMTTAVPEGEVSVTGFLIAVLPIVFAVLLYDFLEFHFIGYFFRGFMGDPVNLTFNLGSKIYEDIVSKCRVLHGRYLVTPWLSSPHFQIAFLIFCGRPPVFTYRRKLCSVSDGGTIALDWLLASDVAGRSLDDDMVICEVDTTPIVIVLPGLTSDSSATMAKHGWNVVVENHRGLGGVSITSDCFYNAGWTEDLREVVNNLREKYISAPLFAIGTSIGANILVKYLGEEGEKTPLAGAASICSPWDLVVCDRFIRRKLVQRIYDRALTVGLKGYAQLLNKNIILATTPHGGHLAYFEGITARSIWWVRAVHEFLSALHFSTHMHIQKVKNPDPYPQTDTSIDKTPYINISEDGLVAVMQSDRSDDEVIADESSEQMHEVRAKESLLFDNLSNHREREDVDAKSSIDSSATLTKRFMKQLSRHSKKSMWLLVYIAIASSWPLVGSAFLFMFRNKLKGYK